MTSAADLLRDERQAALLPGKPRCPVRDGGGRGHHLGPGHQPPVPLLVGALAGDGEIGPGAPQGAQQPVNVASDGTAVRWHSGRVNKHTRRHDQSFSFVIGPCPGRAGSG